MQPVIALVGRPNVGKSTLFNRLTGSRDALVADYPGLTRDRLYGHCRHDGRSAVVIDTGGMGEESGGVADAMHEQARAAVAEADAVILLVDAGAGLTAGDHAIADELRRSGLPLFLAVNKADMVDRRTASAEFHALGIAGVHSIAARRGAGVERLMEAVFAALPEASTVEEGGATAPVETDVEEGDAGIRVAVLGRPNVGKSTLINRLLGEERVVVFDQPGTTRDSIAIPLERDGHRFTLIDTAGIRRRARVSEMVEKFSVVKSLDAIQRASVVMLVTDAREGITDQDAHLAGMAVEAGRALVLVMNKWDGLDASDKTRARRELDRRFVFLGFARRHFISALHGTGVGLLLDSVVRAHEAAHRTLPTPELNELLARAVAAHPPPMVRGRRIKLRYAHQGGHNPPVIVIHGNQTRHVPASYTRYLENFFREKLDLAGTPVRIEYRTSDNPFAGRPNPLTPRQRARRDRVIRHAKQRRNKKRRS